MPEARWGARPFAEQLDFFRRKTDVPSRAWTDLWHEGHDTGFMVAGAYKADLLQDLRGAVDKAIAEGTTLETFRRDFRELVTRHGWSYNGGEAWRTRVIYETNLRSSYHAGRYRQMTDPDLLPHRPWWMYRHSDAVEHPRQEHLGWDGLVLRADDDWWKTHFAPNGWGCQCWIESLSAEDLARLGKSGPDQAPEIVLETHTVGSRGPSPRTVDVPKGIDPGWGYAPGASTISADARRALTDRLPKLYGPLRAQLQQRLDLPQPPNPTLDEAIAAGREILDELERDLLPARRAPTGEALGELRREIRRRLGEARSLSTPAATATRRGAGLDMLREATTRYPDDWTQFAAGAGPLRVRQAAQRGWAYSHPAGAPDITGHLQEFGQVTVRAGEGYMAVGSVDTAIHEYAHRLQSALPALDRYFQELHERRTAGEPLERLADIFPGHGYDQDEVTRRDKYVDAYFGKVYPPGRYGGTSGALEVMTMAFEAVLGDSARRWIELWQDDRQLVELAVGLLFRFRPLAE